jgi:hypothetical protein
MFWRVIVYILVGLFVVFVVLPKLLVLLADVIHRYISTAPPSAPDSSDAKPSNAKPKDKQDKH